MTPAVQMMPQQQEEKLYIHANFKSFKSIMKDEVDNTQNN